MSTHVRSSIFGFVREAICFHCGQDHVAVAFLFVRENVVIAMQADALL